jgi:hypothetical protein
MAKILKKKLVTGVSPHLNLAHPLISIPPRAMERHLMGRFYAPRRIPKVKKTETEFYLKSYCNWQIFTIFIGVKER